MQTCKISLKLALVITGVFCLISSAFVQDTQDCRLDAAMTLWNSENGKGNVHLLIQGSFIYQLKVTYENQLGILNSSVKWPNVSYWVNLNQTKINRILSWYDESDNLWAVKIGDRNSTNLLRFSKGFLGIPNQLGISKKVLSGDSLKEFAVNGISPSRAVFISSYEPGYLWMYHENTKNASWKLTVVSTKPNDENPVERHSKNPEITLWLNNIVKANLTIVGILKTGWTKYCLGFVVNETCYLTNSNELIEQWSYEESFVLFIEDDGKTKHCFGKFSERVTNNCISLDNFQVTSSLLFDCSKVASKTSSTSKPTELGTKTEIDSTTEKKEKDNDTYILLVYIGLVVIIIILHLFVQCKRQEVGYKQVPTSPPEYEEVGYQLVSSLPPESEEVDYKQVPTSQSKSEEVGCQQAPSSESKSEEVSYKQVPPSPSKSEEDSIKSVKPKSSINGLGKSETSFALSEIKTIDSETGEIVHSEPSKSEIKSETK